MRPHTLVLLLVYLSLQGAEDVLIASWLPTEYQDPTPRDDYLPFAIRYRKQVDEQVRPVLPPPSLYQPLGPAPAESPEPAQDRAADPLLAAGLLYTLMS